MDIQYLTVEHVPTKDLIRIFSKITIDRSVTWDGSPCWIWTSALVRGYSHVWWQQSMKHEKMHRVMYAWLVGPIPRRVSGQKTDNLDHLCKRKTCVNPAHLELVPPQVNTLRGPSPAADNHAKTTCSKGHPLDSARAVRGRRQQRYCSLCRREQGRKDRLKASARAKGHPNA